MSGASTTVKQTTRRLGPSMRFVADLSNWENSLHNVSIGQSGQPFSRHFKDQWEAYFSGHSFPMRYSRVTGGDVLRVVP
jgi:penicillin amidase